MRCCSLSLSCCECVLCAGTALTTLLGVAKFSPNEISLFLVDPVTKELARVRTLFKGFLSRAVYRRGT
jgi:hypothetical protein